MPRIVTQDGTVIRTDPGAPTASEPFGAGYRSPDLPPPASDAENPVNNGYRWMHRISDPPVTPDCECPLCKLGFPLRLG
jgi:hypothetical protein